jgi:RNA polymerase sigma-70 factor, ECF subfamily
VFRKKRRDCQMHTTTVNGEPGVVFTSGGAVIHVVSLRIEGGVRDVYRIMNPDKLSRWSVAEID